MSGKKKLGYPENFFMDLYGKESSDTEFADFLIEQLVASDFRWLSKVMYEQRFDIHDILVEYYKEGTPTTKIAEKRGVLYSNVNNHRNWGLRYIRCVIGRNTTIPLDFDTPSQYPVTFSEYYGLIEALPDRAKFLNEKAAEIEKRYAERRYEERHSPLSLTDPLEKLDLSCRVYNLLYQNGITTVGDFISLTEEKKIPGIGVKGWAEIKEELDLTLERLVKK